MNLTFSKLAIHSLALAQTLLWACLYYSFPAMLLAWQQHFPWSIAELSLAFSLALVMSALCSPWVGRCIDHGRGVATICCSALLGGLALLGLSQVQTLWQFYLAWLVLGCASSGCLYEACFAFITRHHRQRAKAAITKVTLYAGFAGTLSFPLCHYLLSEWNWRVCCLCLGLLVLLLALPLLIYSGQHLSNQQTVIRSQARPNSLTRRSLGSLLFWLISLAFSLSALNHAVLINFLLPSLQVLKVTTDQAVLVLSLIGPMQVLGRVVMLKLDRLLSQSSMAIVCFISLFAAASLLWLVEHWSLALWLFVVLQGGAYGVTSILRPVLTRQLLGETNFGAISGLIAVPYLLASASAPFLGAFLWQSWQHQGIFGLATASATLGLIAISFCFNKNLTMPNQPATEQ